jgi:hypothetical protein
MTLRGPRRRGIDKFRLTYLPRTILTTNTQVHATTMVASTSGVRRCLVDAQCQRSVGLETRSFRSALPIDRAPQVVD